MENATRLIVKALPKTLDEKQLLKHLVKLCGTEAGSAVTDCRVIRHNNKSRRFAYIGFRTPEVAATCLKSLQNTFINTSKLDVSFALKEGDSAIPKEWSQITKKKREKKRAKEEADDGDENETKIRDTGRLLIINVPYETTSEELTRLCEAHGKIVEVKLPENAKGIAYVTFAKTSSAVEAYKALQGAILAGRKLRILASDECHDNDYVEKIKSKHRSQCDAKQAILQKKLTRTMDANTWNLLYVSGAVATEVMAKHLGVEVEDIVNTDNTNASIGARVAIAESFVLSATRKWLATLGIPESTFVGHGTSLLGAKIRAEDGVSWSKQTLFIKHLGPWVEDGEELRELLSRCGQLRYFSLAPTKTIAIASYRQPASATRAFVELALYNFKSKPLYLEFAPDIVDKNIEERNLTTADAVQDLDALMTTDPAAEIAAAAAEEEPSISSRKIVVKNLDFTVNAKDLKQLFQTYAPVSSCRLPKRSDGRIRGFAFIEFPTLADAQRAVRAVSDVRLLGRRLVIEPAESKD